MMIASHKKSLLQNMQDSFFIVCLSVISLSNTSEEGNNLLECDSTEFPQVLRTWGNSSKFDEARLKSKHGGSMGGA